MPGRPLLSSMPLSEVIKEILRGFPLIVQWLRLCVSNAEVVGSILVGRTKVPHAEK